MGNRAVITTPERKVGIYLHWNGGRDTIEPLLKYCKLHEYAAPSNDPYGWARMCQVLGNFFGGGLNLGIDAYTDDDHENPGDNGIYIIDGWEIVDRIYPEYGCSEQTIYPEIEVMKAFDAAMPEDEQLGAGFIESKEVPTETLKVGDKVYITPYAKKPQLFTVIGFGSSDMYRHEAEPYVDMYGSFVDYSKNPNNYISSKTCRVPA